MLPVDARREEKGNHLCMRRALNRFRERWPYLPLTWKVAIIGLTLISVFETIRTVVNLFQGKYF